MRYGRIELDLGLDCWGFPKAIANEKGSGGGESTRMNASSNGTPVSFGTNQYTKPIYHFSFCRYRELRQTEQVDLWHLCQAIIDRVFCTNEQKIYQYTIP